MNKGILNVKQKETEQNITEENLIEQDNVDNKLELLKYTSQVQSRIKKDITSDFILAKLNEKDKEGIIEMTSNAYFTKKIIEVMITKYKKYDWNPTKKEWTERHLNKEETTKLNKINKALFDSFMTRITMTAILNRNVNKNYLIRLLAGYDDTEDDTQGNAENIKGIEKLQKTVREKLGMEENE